MNPKIPDEKFVRAVGSEWTSPAGVADSLDCSVSAARSRLGFLFQHGQLDRIKSPMQIAGRKCYLYRVKS